MLDEAEARTQRAIEAISAYLARSPVAADTELGIAQWWLPAMGVDVPLQNVRAALERLVQERVLERALLPDGSVIFRAAPARARP